ncbi:hypothetical protein DXV76_06175 [Rhodobacteraceae bacterium CCMM004]|nr:hypothetical protein DXV76_06175 [Rhodobacteraceae bacterium CCMM004]
MIRHLTLETLGDRALTVTRDFAAPPALLWRAFTEPDLVRRWMGNPGHPMQSAEADVREGGTLRYVWAMPDGTPLVVTGRYVVLDPPRRIVHAESFSPDWTGGETEIETLFDDIDGGTRLTMTVTYATPGVRAAAMATPMAAGMEAGYGQLDALLAEGLPG